MSGLLIVGGLTIDRFADGRSEPGGSVLHAGLAASAEHARITMLTVAGEEPEARRGLSRLRELGTLVEQRSDSTTTYRHEEAAGRRVLIYERATAPIDPAMLDGLATPDVALVAPIADEVPAALLNQIRARVQPPMTVLLIQGWLRRLELGAPVHPLALDEVDPQLWDAFGRADAIVLSTEDLAEAPTDPFAQATALRSRIGRGPILVLTLGTDGHLLDDPAADHVVATVPRRVVRGVPAVGAGDTFGASLAINLAGGALVPTAAQLATERVIGVLEARRP